MRSRSDIIREINALADQKDELSAKIQGLKILLNKKPTKRMEIPEDEKQPGDRQQYIKEVSGEISNYIKAANKTPQFILDQDEAMRQHQKALEKKEFAADQAAATEQIATDALPKRRRRTREEFAASIAANQAAAGPMPSATPNKDPEAWYGEPPPSESFEMPTAPPPWKAT